MMAFNATHFLLYRYAFEKETTEQTAAEIRRLYEEMKAASELARCLVPMVGPVRHF